MRAAPIPPRQHSHCLFRSAPVTASPQKSPLFSRPGLQLRRRKIHILVDFYFFCDNMLILQH